MILDTIQQKFWQSDFGQEYTKRNPHTPKEVDETTKQSFGVTRSQMNQDFLSSLDINNILEVGCNVGSQLAVLQNQGYDNLYGIEIQKHAVQEAKQFTHDINIIRASAFDLPFKDNYFDLVFTSGVLIHISPDDVKKAMAEIYRVSKKYIWGFEYFSEDYQEIEYRGNKNCLWKANFAKIYLDTFPGLKLIKSQKYEYQDEANCGNIDLMFLLEKK